MQKYGLFGRKLGHSVSPKIHELIFKYTEAKGRYELFELESNEIESKLNKLKEERYSGINVTIPHKLDIINYLDVISDEAGKIGAVNTVKFGEVTKGYNTDYFGVVSTFKKYKVDINGKNAIILGAGGSARAVVAALLDNGINEVFLVTRDIQGAETKFLSFKNEIKIITYSEVQEIRQKDILINCTPVGMYPEVDGCPISEADIKGFQCVFDLIYNPMETHLLRFARISGAICFNGLYMLVAQAVRAQEIWNEVSYSIDVMENVYRELEIYMKECK